MFHDGEENQAQEPVVPAEEAPQEGAQETQAEEV